jgi:predicted naringenin-chalcone synthase
MQEVKIIAARKALPGYSRTTEEIIPYMNAWLRGEDSRYIRKAEKIFLGAGVDRRFGIMDLSEVFTQAGFESKNRLYAQAAIDLGRKALHSALQAAQWEPGSLDYIITVSCTGIMIPSLDAYLVNSMGLRQDIIRLPVTEMGCAAGVSGLIYARGFLRSRPGSRAAVVAVESPTATFQHADHSMANIISAAIFGDGASCVLLSSEPGAVGVRMLADGMYHFPEATHLMGFDLTDTGLKMVLSPDVPETIGAHFGPMLEPFLAAQGYQLKDLSHLVFHPGGRKIIQTVEDAFAGGKANLGKTSQVLREYGNMSSATVLYVLEDFMADPELKPGLGLVLSFGPGFTAQRILVEF